MKPGSNIFTLLISFICFVSFSTIAEDRTISTPLINLNELKPSFEVIENSEFEEVSNDLIRNKKKSLSNKSSPSAQFIGLDKITAKTSNIIVNLGEIKKFGPLEIKVLRCGKISANNKNDNVAYLQVKDVSENENEKVFIFNGWTFASEPTLAPFDHAIYDLQLVNCNNV